VAGCPIVTDSSVCLVLASSTGGVGVHVLSLVRELTVAGWQVQVAAPSSTLDVFDFVAAGAQVVKLPIAGPRSYPVAARALRFAGADHDVVHAHGLRAGAVAGLALAGRSTPLVVTWHNAVQPGGRVKRLVEGAGEAFVARAATITLVASSDLGVRVRELGARDVRAGLVAAPAVHVTRTATQVRTELGIADRRLLAVIVGRLHPQKDQAIAVSAAARWRNAGIPVEVVIAGDGPLRNVLQDQIDALDAPVRLLGRRSDVSDLLGASDLALLPSRWEARALVAQEALALGIPLLATNVGGMAELVGPGAVLVPPGDLDAFAAAGARLLMHADERARIGAAGLVRSADWPNEADTGRMVSAVYRELIG
jgi:glycosyltransferase involved in cell wall biosynthesis